MRPRRCQARLAAVVAVVTALGAAPPALARDDIVRSFDGTPIVLSYYRAPDLDRGERAPTVLVGHGFGGDRYARDDDTSGGGESLGPAPLLRQGYNVLSWDARGFGESGDLVRIDSINHEARDVRRLITYVSKQPSARLDGRRDPVIGMAGGSYGGGIQLNTAAIDDRVDALVPGISWNSLVTSLSKRGSPKGGWGTVLYAGGTPSALAPGLVGDAGIQSGALHPQVTDAFKNGLVKGEFSDRNRRFFASRGPGRRVSRIDVPTLLLQGTVDTLFTPQEAVENFRRLRRAGTPVKMIWFCGGHGACLSDGGSSGGASAAEQLRYTRHASLDWFARHLKGRNVRTGRAFRWFADDGRLRSERTYRLKKEGTTVTAGGRGVLPLAPGGGGESGTLIAATPSAEAVRVPFGSLRRPGNLIRPPRLRLSYSGRAAPKRTFVYAQIVDRRRNQVVSNQVTPVPVTLDGKRHTERLRLEIVAERAARGDRYVLQVIPGTNVYFPQRSAGLVRFHSLQLEIPVTR